METTYSVNNGEIKITTTLNRYDIADEFENYGLEEVGDEEIFDVLDNYCMDKDHDGLLSQRPLESLGQSIKSLADYLNKYGYGGY